MKRLVFLAVTALASIPLSAQVVTDDFDKFIQEENASFDKFIDDANKEFIEFLRHPWKRQKPRNPWSDIPNPNLRNLSSTTSKNILKILHQWN